jgi:hypothetical protein
MRHERIPLDENTYLDVDRESRKVWIRHSARPDTRVDISISIPFEVLEKIFVLPPSPQLCGDCGAPDGEHWLACEKYIS